MDVIVHKMPASCATSSRTCHSHLNCSFCMSAASAAAAAVISSEGVLGMWRGGLPAVQRAALANLGELATYDQVGGGGHVWFSCVV